MPAITDAEVEAIVTAGRSDGGDVHELDAGDGWLRERYTELGIIGFENWTDTSAEYEDLDEVAKDRAVVA